MTLDANRHQHACDGWVDITWKTQKILFLTKAIVVSALTLTRKQHPCHEPGNSFITNLLTFCWPWSYHQESFLKMEMLVRYWSITQSWWCVTSKSRAQQKTLETLLEKEKLILSKMNFETQVQQRTAELQQQKLLVEEKTRNTWLHSLCKLSGNAHPTFWGSFILFQRKFCIVST